MKNKLLLFIATCLPMLVMAQKNVKELRSAKVSEFMKHMYVSTSNDPMAIVKAKQLKADELSAQELISTTTTTTLKSCKQKAAVASETGASIDTTHAYPWDSNAQDWSSTPVARMIKTYDAQHNLVLYQVYTRNPDTHEWMDSVQFIYTYNQANQVMNVTQQVWQLDMFGNYNWVNVDYYFHEYDNLGHKSLTIYRTWDINVSDWIYNWKYEYTYDSIGNVTSILEKDWDANANDWFTSLNYENTINSVNQVTLNSIKFLDPGSGSWQNGVQTIYTYDSNGNNISMLYQTWNPDLESWDNCQLKTMAYNSSNKIDSFLIKLWDSFSFQWFDSERGYYKYDSLENNIGISGELYDPYTNSWTSSWQYIYDYNDLNKQISNAYLYWDSNLGKWATGSKTKSFKVKNYKSNNYVASIEIYPNPAKELVYIQNSTSINQIQLFDMLGNEMLLKNYNGLLNIQLDLTNIRSGTYLIKIKDSIGVVTTKKMVKQ